MMQSLSPNIFVRDIQKTIDFYKKLGFKVSMSVPEEGDLVWAMMSCENVTFMFQTFDSLGDEIPDISRNDGGSLLFYIQVLEIRKFHDRIKDKVKVIKDLETTFYGAKEFSVQDVNGFILTFAENA
jgi:uncharacterized glyoxalase superfamily protein PhnB